MIKGIIFLACVAIITITTAIAIYNNIIENINKAACEKDKKEVVRVIEDFKVSDK